MKRRVHTSVRDITIISVGALLYFLIRILNVIDLKHPANFTRLVNREIQSFNQHVYTRRMTPVFIFMFEFFIRSIVNGLEDVLAFIYFQHAVMMCTVGMAFIPSCLFAILFYMALYYYVTSGIGQRWSKNRPGQPTRYRINKYKFSHVTIVLTFLLFSIILFFSTSFWNLIFSVILAEFVTSIVFTAKYNYSLHYHTPDDTVTTTIPIQA